MDIKKNNNVVIFIGPKIEARYHFLSNDSTYGFYENVDANSRVWWPSVTHYIEAKKFEGTQYETAIRNAKTAVQARRLTRERSIIISSMPDGNNFTSIEKRKLYGFGTSRSLNMNIPRKDLDQRLIIDLKYALKHKFKTYPKLKNMLIKTYPILLESADDNVTALVLMEMRLAYKNSSASNSEQPREIIKDLSEKAANSVTACNIRAVIIKTALYISKMEGLDRVFPEMIEDSIYIISPKAKKYSKKWIRKNLNDEAERPILAKYIQDTRKLFSQLDSYQKDTDAPSIKISQFIMWCVCTKRGLGKSLRRFKDKNGKILENLDNVKPQIIIPPGKRWYRTKINIH